MTRKIATVEIQPSHKYIGDRENACYKAEVDGVPLTINSPYVFAPDRQWSSIKQAVKGILATEAGWYSKIRFVFPDSTVLVFDCSKRKCGGYRQPTYVFDLTPHQHKTIERLNKEFPPLHSPYDQ